VGVEKRRLPEWRKWLVPSHPTHRAEHTIGCQKNDNEFLKGSETAERFARIEAQMAEIIRVLNDHGRMLERLPEAVRDKIGFQRQ
jgi:hypothetical protein